ncbi:MAG: TIM-barrel domain-containing protein [Bacillota bacterium]
MDQPRVRMQLQRMAGGVSYWYAVLPTLRPGEEVRYRLCAGVDDNPTAVTEWHAVRAAAWVRAGVLETDTIGGHGNGVGSYTVRVTWGDLSCVAAPEDLTEPPRDLRADVWILWDTQQVYRVRIPWPTAAAPALIRPATNGPSEWFYGGGERYDRLGRVSEALGWYPDGDDVRVEMFVYDQYKVQRSRTYLPVPLVFSSAGYGVYCPRSEPSTWHPGWWIEYRLGGVEPGGLPSLSLHVLRGSTPRELLQEYYRIAGLPVLPPPWVFGPWMSANEWNSQQRVEDEVARSVSLRIPATVCVVEAWSDEATFYIFNDAEYDPRPGGEAFRYDDFQFPEAGRWPNPRRFVANLHRRGLRVLLWQVPVLKYLPAGECRQRDMDEAHAIAHGFCPVDGAGKPYRIPGGRWFEGSTILDFTSERATEWWLSKRRYLVEEVGIDGFKTDGGEHLWCDGVRLSGGSAVTLHNAYPDAYVAAYRKLAGPERVTFSRSGFVAAHRQPLHWAGDEDSTWEALRASLTAGLNAAISGVPFWGWDLGGFSGEIPSAELYLRAASMALFTPVMQYHSETPAGEGPSQARTPWNIEARTGVTGVVDAYRRLACWRMNLLPYIWTAAERASTEGLPMMRPMFFDFPEDPECWKIDDQYMFGDAVMVCPVLQPGVEQREVYFPEGTWVDLFAGEIVQGPSRRPWPAPVGSIPAFVRVPCVLPMDLDPGVPAGEPLRRWRNADGASRFGVATDSPAVVAYLPAPGRPEFGGLSNQARRWAVQCRVSWPSETVTGLCADVQVEALRLPDGSGEYRLGSSFTGEPPGSLVVRVFVPDRCSLFVVPSPVTANTRRVGNLYEIIVSTSGDEATAAWRVTQGGQ